MEDKQELNSPDTGLVVSSQQEDSSNTNNNNNPNVKVNKPEATTTTARKAPSFASEGHKLISVLKIRNKAAEVQRKLEKQDELELEESNLSMLSPIVDFLNVLVDWVLDIIVGVSHFTQGRHVEGALTLFFVFVGGLFVTFDLNVLTRRKGDKLFKSTLRKLSPVWLYLMYIPSLLPFFSSGLKIYLTKKWNGTRDKMTAEEKEETRKKIQICTEHYAVDMFYEGCYESFGQAVLQLVILLEKPTYTSWIDFLPLLGVLTRWYSISSAPITLAKALYGHKTKITELLSGLANKGVTLLAFAMFITASRRQFADPFDDFGWTLILATLIPAVALTIFADLPGIILLRLELSLNEKRKRVKRDMEMVMYLIALLVPITSLVFWTLELYYNDELETVRYYVVGGMFIAGFCTAFMGFCCLESLPWLGKFDTDILLLLYIGLVSYFKGIRFRDFDGQFSARDKEDPSDIELA